jgi:hypothetical protein
VTVFDAIHLALWAACIPLLPYTFFRKRDHFVAIFVLWVYLSFPVLIMFMKQSWDGWVRW